MSAPVTEVIKILGWLPLSIRQLLGTFFGYVFYLIPTRDRAVARLQVLKFLKRSEANSLVRKVYANAGRTALESLNLKPLIKAHPEVFQDPAWAVMDNALKGGQGLITLTAHIGNWDLFGAVCVERGLPLVVVGRQSTFEALQNALDWLRTFHGIQTLWREHSFSARSVVKALSANKMLGVLIDQDTRVNSVMAPFFGYPASTPSALVSLAKRRGTPVVSAFMIPDYAGSYRLVIEDLSTSGSVEEILAEFNRRLEIQIRQSPDQWMWFHKRWRTKEDGTRPRSFEYLAWLEKL
jgi:KDO2-lipid IV(A) lauroyltransferase